MRSQKTDGQLFGDHGRLGGTLVYDVARMPEEATPVKHPKNKEMLLAMTGACLNLS